MDKMWSMTLVIVFLAVVFSLYQNFSGHQVDSVIEKLELKLKNSEVIYKAQKYLGEEKVHSTFVKPSWDWVSGRAENRTFVMSEDGQNIWKVTENLYKNELDCLNDKLEKLHATDVNFKTCEELHAIVFTRWYFVRNDWIEDDRFESQYIHDSELDCGLGKISLTNTIFFGIYRGHRDNRLCPFDIVSENSAGYGNSFMITSKTKELYFTLVIHACAAMSSGILCFLIVWRHRMQTPYTTAAEVFADWRLKAAKFTLLSFLFTLGPIFYFFYKEPFCKSYVLSKDMGRLDGGIGNFTFFLGVPLKIFLTFWQVDSHKSAKILSWYCWYSTIASPLIMTFMTVTKLSSKFANDVIVFGALSVGSLPFILFNFKNRNVKPSDFDNDVKALLDTVHVFTFGCTNFWACVYLVVANNSPIFGPSIMWYNAILPASVIYYMHVNYLHPDPKITFYKMLKSLAFEV